jgi:hypothetical protein
VADVDGDVRLPDGGVSQQAGPWVAVIGMHRSGTSAVTGAVGALGFNLVKADDRLSPHDSNPEHFESLSVVLHDDAILAHFGGTWDAPPRLPDGWEADEGLPDRAEASALLAAAYPRPGPSVWKDPRLCLVLPYWRAVLVRPMAAVLVWRGPLAVARSLQRRDGLPIPHGVALWERYNRSAIANLADDDVYVLDYDAMVENPAAALSGLTSWLSGIGTFAGRAEWDHQGALSVISSGLRHETVTTGDDEGIELDEQRQLIGHLAAMSGGHHGLPQLPGRESPWTQAVLDPRRSSSVLEMRRLERRLEHSNAERDWFASALEDARADLAEAQRQRASLEASSSWRMTAPVRSVAAQWTASRQRRRKP